MTTSQFWRKTAEIYRARRAFWAKRSSAEQGAATLALAQSDVRFLPLPPAFNARPFIMYQWVKAFGMPVYHGKDLWTHRGLGGEPAEPEDVIRQRMERDWSQALELVKGTLCRRLSRLVGHFEEEDAYTVPGPTGESCMRSLFKVLPPAGPTSSAK